MAFDGSTWPGFKPPAPPKTGRPIPPMFRPPERAPPRPGAKTFGPPKQWPKKFGKKKPAPPRRGFVGPLIPHPLTAFAPLLGFPFGELLFPGQQSSDWHFDASADGWTLQTDCPRDLTYDIGPVFYVTCGGGSMDCLTLQGPADNWSPGTPAPTDCVWWANGRMLVSDRKVIYDGAGNPVGLRDHWRQIWTIPTQSPWLDPWTPPLENVEYIPPRPYRAPMPMPAPIVMPDPAADPWPQVRPPWPGYPAPAPGPHPAPAPAPQPQPYPSPTSPPPQPSPDPGWIVLPLPGNPIPMPVPDPVPDPVPAPGTPPYVVPGLSLEFEVPTQTAPRRPTPTVGHVLAPPETKERESKINGGPVAAVFKGAINGVTESADLVDALFDSVNWRAKLEAGALYGYMTLPDKISFLYSNWHLINWREFQKNFLYNAVEDWSYGFLGQGVAHFNEASNNAGFKGGGLGGGTTGDRDNRPDKPDTPPWLDAFREFLERSIGTDVEWAMASGKGSYKTAGRTYGLPQATGGPAIWKSGYRPKKPNRKWKRWSKRK